MIDPTEEDLDADDPMPETDDDADDEQDGC